MLDWLFPKEIKFYDFFDKHAAITLEAARELQILVSGTADIPLTVVKIKELEHKADNVTYQCIECLHKIFITPIDRQEIHKLISAMDDIIDCIDGAARCIATYKITNMKPEASELMTVVVKAVEQVKAAVSGLRDIKNAKIIKEHSILINRTEYDADILLSKIVGDLFENEKDIRTLIKWKEVYDLMEQATDYCEDVANIVDGIIMEQL